MSAAYSLPLPDASPDGAGTFNPPRLLIALSLVTVILIVIGVLLALFYPGTDSLQGEVQRIFYIHVPSFAAAFIAFGAAVFGGIAYLLNRRPFWDSLALAGVEVGLVCSLINLATGSIWARPIWNTWWNWDPRLTSAAIMVLTYSAYLMLRGAIENADTQRRFAAVYGIFAFISVLITLGITRVRPDTIHPVLIGSSPQNSEGGFQFTERIGIVVGFNSFVWSVFLPIVLVWWRMRLQALGNRVELMRAGLVEQY